jgi:hypothetical protein
MEPRIQEYGVDVPLATPGRDALPLLDRAGGITPRGKQPAGAAAITLGIGSSETAPGEPVPVASMSTDLAP